MSEQNEKTTLPTKENAIEKALVKFVQDNKGLCLKLQGQGGKGLPDRLVIMPHKFTRKVEPLYVFVELKSPTGKLSEIQKAYIDDLVNNYGARVEVIDSKDKLERLERFLIGFRTSEQPADFLKARWGLVLGESPWY